MKGLVVCLSRRGCKTEHFIIYCIYNKDCIIFRKGKTNHFLKNIAVCIGKIRLKTEHVTKEMQSDRDLSTIKFGLTGRRVNA